MTPQPPLPDDPAPHPADGDGQPRLTDEVFERLLADSESEIRRSAPKEPSARARMVTERLRRADAEAANAAKNKGGGGTSRKGWRRRGRERQARPEPWRSGPPVLRMGHRRRLPNWVRNTVVALVAAGLAAVALNPSAAMSLVRGRSHHGGTAAPETGVPSPSAAPDPFAGSPADGWADGAAGIALPAARPVGALTRDQVAAALRDVKGYLVAADLDPETLRGGRPAAVYGLVDPLEKDRLRRMDQALQHPAKDLDPLDYVSRYNPKELTLVGGVVKAHGVTTYREGRSRSLEIHADYTFVYPFAKADGGSETVRSIIRRSMDFRVVAGGSQWNMTPGRLWVLSDASQTSNAGCQVTDGFMHPQFARDLPSATPTGPRIDPYDTSKPLDVGHPYDCGTLTRT